MILLIFQVEDVLRLQPVGAGRAGPELVSRVGERVGEGHCAAALGLGRAVGERGLADERGDVAGPFAGVGAAAAAAQEEPLVSQLALAAQCALKVIIANQPENGCISQKYPEKQSVLERYNAAWKSYPSPNPCLNGGDVTDGEFLALADENFGLEGEVPVGEDHVVGVGDARVRDERESWEDGLRARRSQIYEIAGSFLVM